MFEFFLAPQNIPFAVSLTVLVLIALLEGVATIVGTGFLSIIKSILPDKAIQLDLEDVDISGKGIFWKTLSWLRLGQVPLLVLLIVFLFSFGVTGLVLQQVIQGITGTLLPAGIAAIPALLITLPLVRILGGGLARIMPKDETSAVTRDTLIGRVAVLTIGHARPGYPAEAKVKDSFGLHHYIMVEPDLEDDEFTKGAEVLLVKYDGLKFYAIKATEEIVGD